MMLISPSRPPSASYSQPCQRRISAGSRSARQTSANGAAMVSSTATARSGIGFLGGLGGVAGEHQPVRAAGRRAVVGGGAGDVLGEPLAEPLDVAGSGE